MAQKKMTLGEYEHHVLFARQEYRALQQGIGQPYHHLSNILFHLDAVGADYSALEDSRTNDEVYADIQRITDEQLPKHYEYQQRGDWLLKPRKASPVEIMPGAWKAPDGSEQRIWALAILRSTNTMIRQ